MVWLRRITLLLLGAVILGNFFTTEDLRPLPATPAVAQPLATDMAQLRARNRAILEQAQAKLDAMKAQVAAFKQATRQSAAAPTPPPPQAAPVYGPFCTMLGGFAGAVGRDRDAGVALHDVTRTLEEVPSGPLYRVMQAIIFDLYSNPALPPSQAQQTTEALCRQGHWTLDTDPMALGPGLRQ